MNWHYRMRNITSVFFILLYSYVCSQDRDFNTFQYGIALKATVDLNGASNYGKYSNFNLALIGGIGAHPFKSKFIYPSIHSGFLLYNRGDLISSYDESFLGSTTIDFLANFTLSGGYFYHTQNFDKRFVPLYHFSDFTPNPLLNPFQHSISLGTNIIYSPKNRIEQPQRVGMVNIMFDRRFQFSTYNDGSFFKKYLGLADGLDRYFTGGGMFAYHLDNPIGFNLIELSFHKFTGHEKYAFEVANQLQLDFIPYKEEKTYYYNKNRLRLSVSNTVKNFGIHLTAHNTDMDFQDGIHFKGNYTYHQDIFKNHLGLWNELGRLGIGGYWQYINQNFSK